MQTNILEYLEQTVKRCPYKIAYTDGENFMWHEVPGNHDHKVWHLGLYNFAQLVFK